MDTYTRMLNFYRHAYKKPPKTTFNVKRFFELLNTNEQVPDYYMNLNKEYSNDR